MATKFPKFSQALAQDPATRRIWYGIATAHDLDQGGGGGGGGKHHQQSVRHSAGKPHVPPVG